MARPKSGLASASIRIASKAALYELSIATLAAVAVFALECSIDISAEIEANALLITALLALGVGSGVAPKANGGS